MFLTSRNCYQFSDYVKKRHCAYATDLAYYSEQGYSNIRLTIVDLLSISLIYSYMGVFTFYCSRNPWNKFKFTKSLNTLNLKQLTLNLGMIVIFSQDLIAKMLMASPVLIFMKEKNQI